MLEWTAIVSAIVAVVAAYLTYHNLIENKRILRYEKNYLFVAQTETLMVQNPELLELHNIDKKFLDRYNISSKEVIYLAQSFSAGQLFYLIPNMNKNIELTQYRKNMLQNEKVRIIWKKILMDKMLDEGPFVNAVDDYIEQIETGKAIK